MDSAAFLGLVLACAPQVHPDTAHALAQVESSLNPWAIGIVGGSLERQPHDRLEAVATARALRRAGWNISLGLGQINVANLDRLGLSLDDAFEPCTNLAVMQAVLMDCFDRAESVLPGSISAQAALRQALSCYYSGDFVTGVAQGYVGQVTRAALMPLHSPLSAASKELP